MRSLAATLLCVGLGPALALAEPLVVSGYAQLRDLDCTQRDVVIDGVSHVLTLTGDCVSVSVAGAQNSVTFDTAGSVSLSGSSNQVSGALAAGAPGSTPSVDLAGSENVLTLSFGRAATASIAGVGNRLLWSADPGVADPAFRISGANNIAEKQ